LGKIFFSFGFLTLSWTFGEILCLVGIRWVYYELEGRGKRSFIPFVLVCISLCIFCVWLHSGAEPIIKEWLNNRGGAMVYSFNIYYLIKKTLTEENQSTRMSNAYGTPLKGIIIVLLPIVYILYHYYAFDVYSRYNLTFSELGHVLTFYRRIIGLFWITFEGIIAILLFKICSLLNRTKQGD
jgi:hypothetical protein